MPQSSRVMATLEASALSRVTSSPEAEAVPPTANRRTTLISKVILGIARVGARKTSTMTLAPFVDATTGGQPRTAAADDQPIQSVRDAASFSTSARNGAAAASTAPPVSAAASAAAPTPPAPVFRNSRRLCSAFALSVESVMIQYLLTTPPNDTS